jgi:transketolase
LSDKNLDQLAINTIRMLAVDAVEAASSGHPGMPMGMAPTMYELWTKFLKHNPNNPQWPDRDRFVLSGGHGSMLLYSLLHLTGYPLSLDDLKNFRQLGSKTPGHPEYEQEIGIETTTGPLGQGFGNAVGFALAEAWLAEHFNRPGHTIVDHYTYVECGDGDMMEGVTAEAASLAGHLGLGKLIVFYDSNKITIEGETRLAFTEDVAARFRAYGWHVIELENGVDREAFAEAVLAARAQLDKPSLVIVPTVIGEGAPNAAGTHDVHGKPLSGVKEGEVEATKENLGWPLEPSFHIPDEVLEHMRTAKDNGAEAESEWQARFDVWAAEYPELAAEWESAMKGELPEGWDTEIPAFKPEDGPMATRNAGGAALNAIMHAVPTQIGGSADLHPSTKTYYADLGDVQKGEYGGKNLHFGVREHAMGAVVHGLALHGGIIKPYGATFFAFLDYMRPPVRLAALNKAPLVWIYTHDSIGVGEDGPTHQPVEQLSFMRATPNMVTFRPADANEVAGAWKFAMTYEGGPVALILTRQKIPVLGIDGMAENVAKGAYVLADSDGTPDVILLATGSEVHVMLDAREKLAEKGIKARVVSMPSWELFDAQPQSYRDEVLPPDVTKRVSLEAAVTFGWHKYVGPEGCALGVDRFGESGNYKDVLPHFGISADHVIEVVEEVLD